MRESGSVLLRTLQGYPVGSKTPLTRHPASLALLIDRSPVCLIRLALALLQARLGGLDHFKPVGAALQLLRQSPIIPIRTLLGLFSPILRFGLLEEPSISRLSRTSALCIRP
jgi:hypothetical protein